MEEIKKRNRQMQQEEVCLKHGTNFMILQRPNINYMFQMIKREIIVGFITLTSGFSRSSEK